MMYLFSRRTPLSLSCTRNLAIQSGEKWPASRPSCGYSSFLRHSSVISSYNSIHTHTYTPAPAAGTAASSDTPQLSAPTTTCIYTYTPHSTCIYMIILNHNESRMWIRLSGDICIESQKISWHNGVIDTADKTTECRWHNIDKEFSIGNFLKKELWSKVCFCIQFQSFENISQLL